jgi:hypothetical protein
MERVQRLFSTVIHKNVYIALDVLVAVTVTEQVVKVKSPLARYVNDKRMGLGSFSNKKF